MGLDKLEAEDFTPDPISLLESNRNLGYAIDEAISDLIDNSISAGATEISYEMHWNGGQPYFILKDNGSGMSNKDNELINSFRLGSKNPLEERDVNDLGRFGFGMKTASLSQARCLSVITKKKEYNIIARSLDLDFIARNNKWKLKKIDNKDLEYEINYLNNLKSGTIIRWDNWDRAPKNEEDFFSLKEKINNYISVCFHRYIEKGIKILDHDYPISPCSPIPAGEGSQEFSRIHLTQNKDAEQIAYVLQHPKNWKENFEVKIGLNSFRLFEGFERQQGIYIYRCDRLLTPNGGWLGLLKKGNAAKLARVVINYPNNADQMWSLDITKTNASIPYAFRKEIGNLISAVKKRSLSKISHGNRIIKKSLNFDNSRIWSSINDKEFDRFRYIIDINNAYFKAFIEEKKIKESDLKLLLATIQENLPIAKIIDNNDSDPSKHDRSDIKEKLTQSDIEIAKFVFKNKITEMSKSAAFSWLLQHEPFCYYEEQLKEELL